jgi:hypothetical protein
VEYVAAAGLGGIALLISILAADARKPLGWLEDRRPKEGKVNDHEQGVAPTGR